MKNKKQKSEWEQGLDKIIGKKADEKDCIVKKKADEIRACLMPHQLSIFNSRENVNLFLSGQGGGKTYTMGMLSGYIVTNFPKTPIMVAANTYLQLSQSTMLPIFEVWKDFFGLYELDSDNNGNYIIDKEPPSHWGCRVLLEYDKTICFSNGCVLFYGSLDNFKVHDGKELGVILLDETKDTSPDALSKVLLPRLRAKGLYVDANGELTDKKTKNPFFSCYIFTSPQVSGQPWIIEAFGLEEYEAEIEGKIYEKGQFFEKKIDNKYVVISSAMANHEVDWQYFENQKKNIPAHLYDAQIYGNPFLKRGGGFYKCFDRQKHVGKVQYMEDEPLHITFDFNVSPYVTLCVWQIEGKKAMQINEILMRFPKNTTTQACREFKRKYAGHSAGLFIYGDPSGRARDTRLEEGWNDFSLIMNELKDFQPKLKVPTKAPSIVARANFINTILASNFANIAIVIGENCTVSITDYVMLKEDSDGKKLKKKVKNKETGAMEEAYGHTSDANDYFLCEAFQRELTTYQTGGEKKQSIIGQFFKNFNR